MVNSEWCMVGYAHNQFKNHYQTPVTDSIGIQNAKRFPKFLIPNS